MQRGGTSGQANLYFHCVYVEWHGNSEAMSQLKEFGVPVIFPVPCPIVSFYTYNGGGGSSANIGEL